MKVSLNTIKQFTTVDLPKDELLQRINGQLGGVEDVIDLADVYKDAVIVNVVKCDKHPNADKLSVCRVDDGKQVTDVPRDKDGFVEVVCGAPNVHAGMLAVWLPPSSVVPASYHDAEPFVLGSRELRGVVSQGMLASPKELGLGDSHDGILELDADEWKPNKVVVKPGASFAEAYGLDDLIIDIENKMFTHRPDCFGQLGVAREIAGIQGIQFTSPDWYATTSVDTLSVASDTLDLAVSNDAKTAVPRFMAAVIKDVVIKPSPLWLQAELVRLGGKPINNVVDVTNYVMLLTAQPTHAYDYDKLRGHKLGARLAKKGETVSLLNHKTYQLDEADIVIVDGDGPVGLAGIMGGGDSEVSDATTNLVLECANFDMYTVRRSSMRHGVFTDALTRFNKGQSPHQNPYVLGLLIRSVFDVAGGQLASKIFDESATLQPRQAVKVNAAFINQRLGLSLTDADITALLQNVEFDVKPGLEVTPPFWRTDIELPEDVVEEVGRLYGFDKLPRELPQRSIAPAAVDTDRLTKEHVRRTLKSAGANEVLTYSFVHEKLIQKAGQTASHAFKLTNALSLDLQYYRLGLTPSLLDKIHMNIKTGYDAFALFELGKTHFKGEMDEHEPDVPNEDDHLALVVAYGDKQAPGGAPFYHARRYLETVVDLTTYHLTPLADFNVSKDEWGMQLVAAYEPTRSAVITRDDKIRGVVGEFKADVRRAFKLPIFAAGFEVHHDVLKNETTAYAPLSRFPNISQDISIRTPADVSYNRIAEVVYAAVEQHDLDVTVTPITVYKPEDGAETTTTFRLRVTSHDRTLTDDDVRPLTEEIATTAKQRLNGQII